MEANMYTDDKTTQIVISMLKAYNIKILFFHQEQEIAHSALVFNVIPFSNRILLLMNVALDILQLV